MACPNAPALPQGVLRVGVYDNAPKIFLDSNGKAAGILVDPNDASIARSVVALAEALGLSIIAEGVETEAQRRKLESLGCQRFQGYLFSKPVPAHEFDILLASPAFRQA